MTQSSTVCTLNRNFQDFEVLVLVIFHLFFSSAILLSICDLFYLALQCVIFRLSMVVFVFIIKAHIGNFSLRGIACGMLLSYNGNVYLNNCLSVRSYSL